LVGEGKGSGGGRVALGATGAEVAASGGPASLGTNVLVGTSVSAGTSVGAMVATAWRVGVALGQAVWVGAGFVAASVLTVVAVGRSAVGEEGKLATVPVGFCVDSTGNGVAAGAGKLRGKLIAAPIIKNNSSTKFSSAGI